MKSGPIAYFAGNPIAANLLMGFFIIGGIIAGFNLPIQSYPELDLRTISVKVKSPGSSTREVEEDIVSRVENQVIGLPGVERVVATAHEGLGEVLVELATFADADSVLNNVQDAVNRIENFPPVTAEQPEVQYERLGIEVMTLAVSSPSATENDIRSAAEQLRDRLLELPSVSLVTLLGTRDREIAIELSEEELRRNGLSVNAIADAVRRASLNLTSGELRTDAGGLVLHTVSKRKYGEEFSDIPLITRLDGTVLNLGDVAVIRDGFADEDIHTRVDGDPAVLVRVDAANEQSIVTMAEDIRDLLGNYSVPAGITIELWNDRAGEAIERISLIIRNAVIGAVLVFLCLVFLFDLRIATWVTVGIPLSFIGSLMFFGPADLTLNLGTIFAFFLLVGIVVDDAVVVGESIAAQRESGKGALEAAVSGARAMVGPITIGTITTIIAFLPFLFVTPVRLQIVKVFPYVTIFVLLVSLIEAFFILPAHLSHKKPWSLPPLSNIQARARERLLTMRAKVVIPAVSWSMRRIWFAPVCGLILVVLSLALIRSDSVRVIYFDSGTNVSDDIQIDLVLPIGTPFDVTRATAERFVEAAQALNDQGDGTPVEGTSVLVGNLLMSQTATTLPNRSHLASVVVHLNQMPVRGASIPEIERKLRQKVGDVSNLENIMYHTRVSRAAPAVAYALKHDDLDILNQATTAFSFHMEKIPGIYGISDSLTLGKRQLEIELTPVGRASGLSPAVIAAQLRASYHGTQVQRIQRGHDEVKVVVRYPKERRTSMLDLARERIHRPAGRDARTKAGIPASGGEIPLYTVANLIERRDFSTSINIDGKQTARVNAEADAAVITPLQARRVIGTRIIPGLIERFPGLVIEPDGSAREEKSTLRTLSLLVPLALIAIYVLTAAFLRSYWKPLIAVLGIPVAFAGGVIGHWILGWDFGFLSLFGVIGVGGVIVNDSLVLMDRYNQLRRENKMLPAIAAASAATRQRFRAVFLTSLTTILALAPLLYERSDELMFLVPFVVSMVGGLIFSGLFILFMLPSLVMMAEAGHE